MHAYISDFLKLTAISPKLEKELANCIQIKQVKKGEMLVSRGDLRHRVFYVRKGLLRSYTIDEKGKEHIYMFAPEAWVVGDLESVAEKKPTILYVDALEDTEVEVIDEDRLIKLKENFPELGSNEGDRLLRRIAVLQRRVIMLMSASAQDRYEAFLEKYPNLVQRVTQRMIASYLGITPEALSKIRGDMSRS